MLQGNLFRKEGFGLDGLLREMHEWMTSYMKSFYTEDEEVMQGIRIKEVHTGYVTANAVALSKSLGLSERGVQLSEVMGLFPMWGGFASTASTRPLTMPCLRTMRSWG